MTKGLIRLFVKDSDNVTDAKVRERYGMLAGIVAVVCNVLPRRAQICTGHGVREHCGDRGRV